MALSTQAPLQLPKAVAQRPPLPYQRLATSPSDQSSDASTQELFVEGVKPVPMQSCRQPLREGKEEGTGHLFIIYITKVKSYLFSFYPFSALRPDQLDLTSNLDQVREVYIPRGLPNDKGA